MKTNMKTQACLMMALIATALLNGGCASTNSVDDEEVELCQPRIALAVIGPIEESNADASPTLFHLGAGDTLGQAIYANYVSFVSANGGWRLADAVDAD